MDKAKALYCLLQDGGFERHTQISAGDKDFEPVFETICKLTTGNIFDLAKDAGAAGDIYTQTEIKELLKNDNLVVVRED